MGMTVDEIVAIANRALYLIIKVSAPVLLVSLAIGLIVSIIQTITSIQEQTLTLVPKIIGVFVTLILNSSFWYWQECCLLCLWHRFSP